MTPDNPIGLPTTPEGRRLFQESAAAIIRASKQRLVDIGYTDVQGNLIRPEMGRLPTDNRRGSLSSQQQPQSDAEQD